MLDPILDVDLLKNSYFSSTKVLDFLFTKVTLYQRTNQVLVF